jgi:osmotically inducible lipoprotein OsmB
MNALNISATLLALLAISACGHNIYQRSATGALAGAVVGGPIGAGVGAAGGAVASRVMDN